MLLPCQLALKCVTEKFKDKKSAPAANQGQHNEDDQDQDKEIAVAALAPAESQENEDGEDQGRVMEASGEDLLPEDIYAEAKRAIFTVTKNSVVSKHINEDV